ncbi:MAG: rhodanese-like domain-containing protein [Methanobacterium paludis]|uniref:Rhodanese-like protein n=1 Tax=Methanobacterium paludis (strain DSM 25820 / JCM 18151 / SWAN1) TaxID=868131 RepID=F6D6F1_METPW|nr:rhodanese-like domain-containing protein [Methanobacterium paludis]AEG19384.1 Rhodanese-like protein [Methanobacterium paludis]MCE7697367.1 rhodanese-like domain-containing protein [Methanobacterium paludis]
MSTIKNITPIEALKLMENEDFIILDVRAPWEFAEGHIKNAENLDFTDPDFSENLEKFDKNKKYIVYCKTGRRGGLALKAMKEAGFTEVYNLIGGYVGWNVE